MVTHVYLWRADKNGEVFDHASLGLSDNTYISWWNHIKQFSVVNLRENGTAESLSDDIFLQSGRYPNTFTLIDIDEDKVKQWWNRFKNRKEAAYDHGDLKSVSVVFRALCEGEDFFQKQMATCISSKELEVIVKQYMTDRDIHDRALPFQKFVWCKCKLPKLDIIQGLQAIKTRFAGKSTKKKCVVAEKFAF